AFVRTISGTAPLSQIVTRYRSMRRGSSSGPSDDTTNAISTFAASVCASDVFPAALRTIALRRGKTLRISPSLNPTQSPTATSAPSCTSRPGSRVRSGPPDVVRCAMRSDDAARLEAGAQFSGELGTPPERAQNRLGQRKAPSGRGNENGAPAVSREELRPSRG